MQMMRRAVVISSVFSAAILGAVSAARAASYTVALDIPISISRIVAVDQDTNGVFHESWPYSLTGPGVFTLTNPNPSPNLNAFFLIGTYFSTDDNKDHIFLTANTAGASFIEGKLFPDALNGIHEGTTVQAIKDITSGGGAGDPTVDGGLSYLNNFATVNHDLLFTGFGDPVVSMHMTIGTIISPIPLPAAAGQGGLLLGLLTGAGMLKRRLGRRRAE